MIEIRVRRGINSCYDRPYSGNPVGSTMNPILTTPVWKRLQRHNSKGLKAANVGEYGLDILIKELKQFNMKKAMILILQT
jgi:hypothetical protein